MLWRSTQILNNFSKDSSFVEQDGFLEFCYLSQDLFHLAIFLSPLVLLWGIQSQEV